MTRKNHKTFEGKKKNKHPEDRFIIKDNTEESVVLYDMLEKVPIGQAVVILNTWRRGQVPPLDPISYSAVNNFVVHSNKVKITARGTQKSGKKDMNSPWAQARLGQCRQFKEQLRLGTLQNDHPDLQNAVWPPVYLHGLVFLDEKHQQTCLGLLQKNEILISRNEHGEPTAPEFGGSFPERHFVTTVKYPGEARGCFGVALRKKEDGTVEGVRLNPFNYTGRTVVGVKTFESYKKIERERVKQSKGCWGKEGQGYEHQYGDNWEAELVKAVSKEYCCITELMDSVVTEAKRVYEGTEMQDKFFIFHDGLKAWWEKEAQNHLNDLGFRHRQLCCLDPTNQNLAAYRNKVAGDSPEICRGLDSHGFADLLRSIILHTSITCDYDDIDPRKFKTGTPEEVWSTMSRCWQIDPTSERIVEDIEGFSRVLDIIIEHSGCVVPDMNFRTGRGAKSHDNKRVLKRKIVARQRISTQKSLNLHADAQEAFDKLIRK